MFELGVAIAWVPKERQEEAVAKPPTNPPNLLSHEKRSPKR